ncbi:two component transcriptional regulator, LytTR family [Filimonas lacunae]|uniref:Two component transcriptional regulator, LytTR family n=1 Tax=Filimonas lacunae TaxID=477680 RepID=A0A173MI04_9BACT|nr:LytTR family DNA-binding domain-containing protein [Filimonas lacunae]BAV07051.1 two-component system response regulator [Filimonas lacunae]SIS95700.1 two component transcriptional regulator, LytTR family [Filimonas lacunae]
MKVLIIEDEELAANTLQHMLQRITPQIAITAILETVQAAVSWLSTHPQPDVIFMDIHLGDGESFHIFEEVTVNSPVIFTTAYDQYMLKAFKHQGIDYLLKPFEESDVRAALDKLATIRQTTPIASESLPALPAGRLRNRFMVKIGNLIKTIQMEDVAYFMASDKYLFMVTKDQQRYIIEETIASIAPQLNPSDFFRINRKFIIHISAIKEMHRLTRNRVQVILTPTPPDGIDSIVSEDRAEEFKQWLDM